MIKKALGALVALAVLAPGLPAGAQGNAIRIGASLSLTGTYAALGHNQHRGYQLCMKHVNEKGGVLGRKIEFVLYDDQSQPATGVRLYERLITQDKVDAVLGPYSSAITEAVANVNEKYKMPMVAPMASTTA
ncbi:MAG: ABC transporter substrate-binding protein, partial [Candidatus Rokuibacteriota bacterium]